MAHVSNRKVALAFALPATVLSLVLMSTIASANPPQALSVAKAKPENGPYPESYYAASPHPESSQLEPNHHPHTAHPHYVMHPTKSRIPLNGQMLILTSGQPMLTLTQNAPRSHHKKDDKEEEEEEEDADNDEEEDRGGEAAEGDGTEKEGEETGEEDEEENSKEGNDGKDGDGKDGDGKDGDGKDGDEQEAEHVDKGDENNKSTDGLHSQLSAKTSNLTTPAEVEDPGHIVAHLTPEHLKNLTPAEIADLQKWLKEHDTNKPAESQPAEGAAQHRPAGGAATPNPVALGELVTALAHLMAPQGQAQHHSKSK